MHIFYILHVSSGNLADILMISQFSLDRLNPISHSRVQIFESLHLFGGVVELMLLHLVIKIGSVFGIRVGSVFGIRVGIRIASAVGT